jgi:DNA invertase Pin-like site-specific DNA recombinase
VTVRLSTNQIDALIEAYVSGASAADCAARFGVHEQTVRNHLARRGIARRVNRRKLSDAEVETAIERHRNGESGSAIARSLHVSPDTVLRELGRSSSERGPCGSGAHLPR